MCLNRRCAHARAAVNGLLRDVSASSAYSYLILLHTHEVCFG